MLEDPLATKPAINIICAGALAFMTASIAHEAIGHGGGALITGADITLISSVYFRANGAGALSDSAGPISNLALGGLLFIWLRKRKPKSPHWHLFLAATMATNFFWGTGYFLYTGISGKGDWAFLIGDPASSAALLQRGGLVAIGFYCYRFSIAAARDALLPFSDMEHTNRPLLRVAGWLYLSAGLTCCIAAFFFRGPVVPALKESILESFVAFAGLLIVGFRAMNRAAVGAQMEPRVISRDVRWILSTTLALAAYVAVMGRGYFG